MKKEDEKEEDMNITFNTSQFIMCLFILIVILIQPHVHKQIVLLKCCLYLDAHTHIIILTNTQNGIILNHTVTFYLIDNDKKTKENKQINNTNEKSIFMHKN